MESDAIKAQGATRLLKERLFEVSDAFTIKVCKECGHLPSNSEECNVCKGDDVGDVHIPYATKLLIQNLMAMNMKIKITPTD